MLSLLDIKMKPIYLSQWPLSVRNSKTQVMAGLRHRGRVNLKGQSIARGMPGGDVDVSI